MATVKQKIQNLLKTVDKENAEEVDSEIRTIQTDNIMRPIKKDIERYGMVEGRKLA